MGVEVEADSAWLHYGWTATRGQSFIVGLYDYLFYGVLVVVVLFTCCTGDSPLLYCTYLFYSGTDRCCSIYLFYGVLTVVAVFTCFTGYWSLL